MSSLLAGAAIPPLPFRSIRLNQKPQHYRCPRDWRWQARLRDHDLWVVLGGRGLLAIDGKPLPIAAPVAVLLRPGESIDGTHDPRTPLEVVYLHFTPIGGRRRGLDDWESRMRNVRLRPLAHWRELAELSVVQLNRNDELSSQQSAPMVLTLLTTLWRLAHTPIATEGDDRIERMVRRIQRSPEESWSLQKMQREARRGATRVNTRIRQLTGFSPARWVIRCRVERASVLLRDTSMKIAGIAEACGYTDLYFFARQFRNIMGMPPGAWRRACAARDQRIPIANRFQPGD
jgi:AraC family transcriptional regulator of arabinose operon